MMIAEELRKSLLQAAIQGKLTKQLESDGDAHDLLKEIKIEKDRLVKEEKIKIEKQFPKISEDEIPFEIPENWCWVRLGNIGVWSTGATPNRANGKYYLNGTIPWVKTGDLNDYLIENTPEHITRLALQQTSVKLQPIGTVLIAMYGATIGKLSVLAIEATTNQACCGCNTFSGIDNWYLFYFLMSHKQEFINQAAGGAQPNISREKIIANIMPLPPLSEQHRIVEKLEKILPEIKNLQKEELLLETTLITFPKKMKDSILQAAIQGKLTEQLPTDGNARDLLNEIKNEKDRLVSEGKIKKEKPLPEISEGEIPFEIPENWCWVRLGNIGVWSTGATPNRANGKYYLNGTIPWVKTGDLNDYLIENTPEHITRLALQQTSVKLQPIGTVLIAMYGATIGKLSVLAIEATTNQACCGCNTFSGIDNWYLFYFLMSHKQEFINQAAGGAQPNISREKIIVNIMPIPPLSEQHRIVEKLEKILPEIKNF